MEFNEKVPRETAEAEVSAYLDTRVIMPKRRDALEPAINCVVEATMYGYVSFNDDGTITQKLIEPAGKLTELVYKKKVAAADMQREISGISIMNQSNLCAAYIKAYSGKLNAEIAKLEPADRNTADSIALFFQ